MTEDTFVDRNQFRGDPTLDGVSEDGNSLSSLTSFFGSLAQTYSTVKTALDNKAVTPAQVQKQSVGVSGFKGNYVIIAAVTLAAVLALVLVLRK